jgi:hypothetical protein
MYLHVAIVLGLLAWLVESRTRAAACEVAGGCCDRVFQQCKDLRSQVGR